MLMPRYQKAGVRIASAPGVTTVGMQEAARTSQTLSQAMDRVTSFALRQAETQAKIQGEEYGALNAPTQQQLADALAEGKDVAELIPGDKTTIFGRSARNAALAAAATTMEIEASRSIVGLQSQFEAGEITLDQLQGSLDALTTQQTEVMRAIDPVSALKFSASVATTGNAAYLAAAKKQAKDNAKDLEIQYRSGVDDVIRGAETIVRAGPTVGADGTVVSVDQKIDVIRNQITAAAQIINDPEFYQTKMGELDAAITEAKIGVVMDEAIMYPERSLRILRGKGEFMDQEVQATFATMNNEEKRELYSQVQSALSTQFSLESAADAKTERMRAKLSNETQAKLTKAMLDGDSDMADMYLEELRTLDPAAYASKAKTLATTPGIDKPDTITLLRRKSLNNTLTASDIDTAYQRGEMSLSTYKEFTTDLESQRNQAFNDAVDWLKLDRGLPAGTLLNFSAVQREADREVAAIKKDLLLEIQKDPALDPMKYVQDRVKTLVAEGGAAADRAIRERAEGLLEELRIGTKNQSLTAQQALDLLNSQPEVYPNEQKRRNAIENLLPALIEIESR